MSSSTVKPDTQVVKRDEGHPHVDRSGELFPADLYSHPHKRTRRGQSLNLGSPCVRGAWWLSSDVQQVMHNFTDGTKTWTPAQPRSSAATKTTPTDVSCDEDFRYPARRFCSALQTCRLVHGALRVKRFVVSTDGEVGDGRRSKGLVDAPSSR